MNYLHRTLHRVLSGAMILACIALRSHAGNIDGTVFDATSKSTLPGASVELVENGRTAVTNGTGRFQFQDLPAGTYKLLVRYLGFGDKTETVTVPETGNVSVTIPLGDDVVVLSEFKVEGYREGRAKALQQKQTAQNVMDIISSDSVGNLPDRNIADAVSRLPGISIDVEGGEGRWVTIRGLEPTLNNVTLNGATVATPDTDGRAGRAMPLDVIGSSQVSQIQVVKSVTPDMDGNALGGSINIVTGTAFDHQGRFIQGSVEGGSNSLTSGQIVGVEGSYSNFIGEKHDKGVNAAFHYSHRPFREDEVQGDFKQFNDRFYLETFELHPTEGTKDRLGLNLDFDFHPENGGEFYIRTLYNSYSQERTQSQNNYTLRRDPTFLSDTSVQVNRMRYDARTSYGESEQRLFNISAGGSKQFGDWTLKGDLTFSQAKEWNPVSINAQFRTGNVNTPNPLFVWDWADFYPVFDQTIPTANPSLYQMRRLITETRDIKEDTWSPRIDLRKDDSNVFGGHPGYYQAGIKVTKRHRFVDRESTRPNSGSKTLANLDAATSGQDLYDKRYMTPLTVDVNKVFDYYYSHLTEFTVDPVDEGQNEVEDDYDTHEDIYAAYAMTEVQLSDKLTAIAGARYEKTDASITSFEMRLDDNNNIIGVFPTEADFNYNNFLPNLQFRYSPTKRDVVRLAITGTIGRPRYEDTASQSILTYAELVDPDNPAFPYTGTVDPVGNPDLQPYEAVNFDLSYERYLKQGGLISIAAFYKVIDNPIYNYRAVRDDYVYNGLGFEELELRSVQNAKSGYVSGIELNLQIPFSTFTSSFFGRFGVDLNTTFIKSGATLNADPDIVRDIHVPFFRQPDRIANLGFYYQGPRLSARIAYNYQSNSIREIADTAPFDIYQGARNQLDFQVNFKITENYRLYANWQNVNDTPTVETFGDDTNLIRRGLLYGSNVRAGIKFIF